MQRSEPTRSASDDRGLGTVEAKAGRATLGNDNFSVPEKSSIESECFSA